MTTRSFKLGRILFFTLSGIVGIAILFGFQRYSDYRNNLIFSKYICSMVVPRLQTGAIREVEDYLNSAVLTVDSDLKPSIQLSENGHSYSPVKRELAGTEFECIVPGRSDVELKFKFAKPPVAGWEVSIAFLVGTLLFGALRIITLLFVRKTQAASATIFNVLLAERFSIPLEVNDKNFGLRAIRNLVQMDERVIGLLDMRITDFKLALEKKNSHIFELERNAVTFEIARQVSHDIRSPLSVVNLIVSSSPELSPEKKTLITEAIKRINGIAGLILKRSSTEVKDVSQCENASDITDDEAFSLTEMTAQILSEKRALYTRLDKLSIITDFNSETPCLVRASRIGMASSISNLITNSVEAIRDGDGKIQVSLREQSNSIILSVLDSGAGIPEELMKSIGQKGASFGKTSTESGSGLGVYFAKKMVERAGGRLRIQSKVGCGTIVSMEIPKAIS